MEFKRSQEPGGVEVVSLQGRFDASSAPETEIMFRNLLAEGVKRLVVDLSGVDYISSGGLRVLVMLAKTTDRNQGRLALCGLTPFVAEVFQITNLANLYTIRTTVEEARSAVAESE